MVMPMEPRRLDVGPANPSCALYESNRFFTIVKLTSTGRKSSSSSSSSSMSRSSSRVARGAVFFFGGGGGAVLGLRWGAAGRGGGGRAGRGFYKTHQADHGLVNEIGKGTSVRIGKEEQHTRCFYFLHLTRNADR